MSSESITLYKLMILFMLDHIAIPLTNSQISEFFVGKNYTTYFHIQQAINELLESDFIRGEVMRNTTSYHLTGSGQAASGMFDDNISDDIKKEILEYFEEHKYELRRQSNITADYYQIKNGEYMVKASIKEKGNVLMELGLNVVSKSQAIAVCDAWNQKCEKVYQTVIEELLLG